MVIYGESVSLAMVQSTSNFEKGRRLGRDTRKLAVSRCQHHLKISHYYLVQMTGFLRGGG